MLQKGHYLPSQFIRTVNTAQDKQIKKNVYWVSEDTKAVELLFHEELLNAIAETRHVTKRSLIDKPIHPHREIPCRKVWVRHNLRKNILIYLPKIEQKLKKSVKSCMY